MCERGKEEEEDKRDRKRKKFLTAGVNKRIRERVKEGQNEGGVWEKDQQHRWKSAPGGGTDEGAAGASRGRTSRSVQKPTAKNVWKRRGLCWCERAEGKRLD